MNETDELAIALMAAAAKWAAGAVAEYAAGNPGPAGQLGESLADGGVRFAVQIVNLLDEAPMIELLAVGAQGAVVLVAQHLRRSDSGGWTLQ